MIIVLDEPEHNKPAFCKYQQAPYVCRSVNKSCLPELPPSEPLEELLASPVEMHTTAPSTVLSVSPDPHDPDAAATPRVLLDDSRLRKLNSDCVTTRLAMVLPSRLL
jgi:hypothetical protein